MRAPLLLGLALILGPVPPSQDPDIKIIADYGWGAFWRPGCVTPVRIVLDNPGGTVRGRLILRWSYKSSVELRKRYDLEDLDGSNTAYYEIPIAVPEKSRQVHTAYVMGEEDKLHVVLKSDDGAIRGRAELGGQKIPRTNLFLGVVGRQTPPMLRNLGREQADLGFIGPEDLPDRWYGYAGLDTLVWADGDATLLRNPAQAAALKQWVIQGGHLVVIAEQSATIKKTFLEELLPAKVTGDSVERLDKVISVPNITVPKAEASVLQMEPLLFAERLISAPARPAAFARAFGRGRVTLVGVDLCKAPFTSWKEMPFLWREIIARRPLEPKDPNAGVTFDPALYGIGSLKLLSLAQQFPGITPPSLGWAFVMIVALILLVGPIDYLVLRRLKQFELTWITFPSMVLGVSAIALLGKGTYASGTTAAREMAVVDHYQDYGIGRGWSLYSVLTIDEQKFQVDLSRGAGTLQSMNSSAYSLGSNYGGGSGGAPSWHRWGDKAAVDRWSLAQGGQGVMAGQWCGPAGPAVTFQIQGMPPAEVTVTVDNPFREPVLGAILVHESGVYSLDTIPPGRSSRSLSPAYRSWVEGIKINSDSQMTGVFAGDEYTKPPQVAGDALQSSIRLALISLSFSKGLAEAREPGTEAPQFSGIARDLDSTDYLRGGGWILLGTLASDRSMSFNPSVYSTHDVVLIRTFHR